MARRSNSATQKAKAPVQLTGGKGFRYENQVAARCMLDMLGGTNVLGASFGRVTRVDWQARDAGWLLEDLAISCSSPDSGEHIAGISIKSHEQLGVLLPDFSPTLRRSPGQGL